MSNLVVQLYFVQLDHELSFLLITLVISRSKAETVSADATALGNSPHPTRHISSLWGWSPRNVKTSRTIWSPDSRTIAGADINRSRSLVALNIFPSALVASVKPSVYASQRSPGSIVIVTS